MLSQMTPIMLHINANECKHFQVAVCIKKSYMYSKYRTRANNGRSQLVAAPLSSQAKMHFSLAFYVTI